jgi:hypothetical protein
MSNGKPAAVDGHSVTQGLRAEAESDQMSSDTGSSNFPSLMSGDSRYV